MNDNNYFIKVSNEWFYVKDGKSLIEQYNHCHFVIYILLLRNLTLRNTCIFNINMIKDLLLNEGTTDSRQINIIKDTLKSLHDNGIITLYLNNCCTEEFIDFENNNKIYYAQINNQPKNNFFILYDSEIDVILNFCKGKEKRGISIYNLLVYFGMVIKVINSKDKVGYCTYEVLQYKFGFSADTISKFNEYLTKLKLIRYNNTFYDIRSNRSLSNIYARFKDEEQFNIAVENRKKTIEANIILTDKKGVQDLKRSIKKKLNVRWEKYDNNFLTDKQINELEQLEKDYYNLIHKEKTKRQLKKIGFRVINIEEYFDFSNKWIGEKFNNVDIEAIN